MRTSLRSSRRLRLLAAAALGLSACTTDSPTAPRTGDVAPTFGQLQQDLQGLYLIQTRGPTEAVAAAVRRAGATVRAELPQIGVVTVAGLTNARLAAVARHRDVVAVFRDAMVGTGVPRPSGQPLRATPHPRVQGPDQSGAFFFAVQWNLPITGTVQSWAQTASGAGRTVWVLDSGYDPNQSDLGGHPPCYTNGITVPRFPTDLSPLDFNFHGSFVSGIIATNGLGTASVAPSARVCTRKVLSEDGFGSWGDVIAAIIYAADHRANVINLSLGAYLDRRLEGAGSLIAALQAAVSFANRKGAVVVVASGNDGIDLDEDGRNFIQLPAQLNKVISVGASAPDLSRNFDALASYSNYGGRTGIDLVAPGGDLLDPDLQFDLIIGVCSTFVCGDDNFYVLASGTSFAAPHVSAAAAIIQGELGAPSPATVEQCIKSTADKVGKALIFGSGRLNVQKAGLCTG